MSQSRLTVTPITLREANAYVERIHRHHGAARGCFFCIAVVDEQSETRGVAIVGRPVARRLHDGYTADVLRAAGKTLHTPDGLILSTENWEQPCPSS